MRKKIQIRNAAKRGRVQKGVCERDETMLIMGGVCGEEDGKWDKMREMIGDDGLGGHCPAVFFNLSFSQFK